ncbi:site-specific integrase [Noviherbaspirillum sp. Root189]|uniref:site-specific integrase n=1 Tax=Noviherbaspirillum sp. Root189 TaxID=1736487 RepID=UPI00070D6EF5|nr:site-specific integrase [Noviherbaspirillum sp. Root189]KRB81049.1 integrase [Noviherbaspirillum sp. Root189]
MEKSQRLGFHAGGDDNDVLAHLCASLPKLPSVLRYYDEFDDAIRSIRNPEGQAIFELRYGGRRNRLDFARLGPERNVIFKHVFALIVAEDLSVGTVAAYLASAQHLTQAEVTALVSAGPTRIGSVWKALRVRALPTSAYMAAKYLLQLLCAYRLNGWASDYVAYIHTSLPLPVSDRYAGVRSGDVFLSVDEEARIVRHLDDVVERLAQSAATRPSLSELADAGMLLCSYQFAMRPIQIAMLDVRHVRIWNDDISDYPAVHLTFHMAKQRGSGKRIPMTRRVKAEWAPLFVQWKAHLDAEGITGSVKFFQVESTWEVSNRISTLVRALLDSDDIGTATDLRHTAAQRLVDAGASHEELAEFLGHAHTSTGLVYYATSASHAERINRALGASAVYQRVAKIAHDRFISPEELAELKGEQQIAAVPHGIPIAGIGGCTSGQPACPYNPVTSCYGCRKFMPVHDKAFHEQVLADMRGVVLFFDQSSRGDTRSPAYLQLQRTIAEIQIVITEIEEREA